MEAEATSEDTALLAKREEVKRHLEADKYKTLGRLIADKAGRFIQRLTRRAKPLPFWYSITVVLLAISMLGSLVMFFLDGVTFPPETIYFEIALGLLTPIFVITLELYIVHIFEVFKNHIVDRMESLDDLNDLQDRTEAVFSISNQFVVAVVYTIFISIWAILIVIAVLNTFSVGLAIIGVLRNFIAGIYFYFFIRGLPLLLQLRKYQYKVYSADPSSSEVVERLSNMLGNGVFIVAIYATALTAIMAFIVELTRASLVSLLIVLAWGPTISFFVANQFILGGIISQAKMKTLNGIQAQVEALQTKETILSAETLGHIDKLMDYHDRIKATKNSALNLRASLSFLNSLLLPVIAFLLANLNQIIELFSN